MNVSPRREGLRPLPLGELLSQPRRTRAGPVLCPRLSQRPPPAVSWPQVPTEKTGSSGRTPGPPCSWGAGQPGSFPTALPGTNFVSFTSEPEHNSETQGQGPSVSRSTLPAITPALLCSPPTASAPREAGESAMHLLCGASEETTVLHATRSPHPTGPGDAQPSAGGQGSDAQQPAQGLRALRVGSRGWQGCGGRGGSSLPPLCPAGNCGGRKPGWPGKVGGAICLNPFWCEGATEH